MSVILYARVSTGEQAERDLSIPAQFRALRTMARNNNWGIAAEYQDVGSGKSFRERPGLVAAIRHATHTDGVEALVVHRVDRLSRNIYDYLTLKAKLRRLGIKIISYVEHFESNPIGEFLEHVMAAQAEFYSANLSFEIKKGIDERARRGKWSGAIPVGYLKSGERLVHDPARAPQLRYAFERWATGTVTSLALADELYAKGLTSKTGKKTSASHLCDILRNPFYAGKVKLRGATFPGQHAPLVSADLFERCQEVFRQKVHGPGKPRRKLEFILARKILCPSCGRHLVGEEHRKRARIFRYYRCHQTNCSTTVSADEIEADVRSNLLALQLPKHVAPLLERRLRRDLRQTARANGERIRSIRLRRRALDTEIRDIARAWFEERITQGHFDARTEQLRNEIRSTEALLAEARRFGCSTSEPTPQLEIASNANAWLDSDDPILQRRVMEALVANVSLVAGDPNVLLHEPWRTIMRGGNIAPKRQPHLTARHRVKDITYGQEQSPEERSSNLGTQDAGRDVESRPFAV